ncbi:Hypothetical protein A7982_07769 [Minicystis rosea]|nr:Hypothetical protein A7982_07769 [Minicystis rosea]
MLMRRRIPWKELYVWTFETPCLHGLDGKARLAALHRWKNGQAQCLVWFYRDAEELRGPEIVDWSGFPEHDAERAAAAFPPISSPLF